MSETTKPIRSLHVLGSLTHGGLETWVMDIVRNINRDEIHIDVCVIYNSKGAYEKEFEDLGGKILRCHLNKKKPLLFYRNLKKLFARERYDVVHSHMYYFNGLILRAAAKANVAKRVAHIHPAEDFKKNSIPRRLYAWVMKQMIKRYGTDFVGPTKASLEGFWGSCWQNDQSKHVIYNGIKLERFAKTRDRSIVRKEIGIPEDAHVVLNVSRYVPHKRHEYFIKVAENVLKQRPNVYFVLIGDGPLKGDIESQVSEMGIKGNFRFLSGVANIDDYFMSSDVFAFTSCNEGFGIVIIEAAAAGLKVIAQDIPGVREAVKACFEPILLPVEMSPEGWAKTLIDTLDSPEMSQREYAELIKSFPFKIESSILKLKEIYTNSSGS